jgi:hypothetical protein
MFGVREEKPNEKTPELWNKKKRLWMKDFNIIESSNEVYLPKKQSQVKVDNKT